MSFKILHLPFSSFRSQGGGSASVSSVNSSSVGQVNSKQSVITFTNQVTAIVPNWQTSLFPLVGNYCKMDCFIIQKDDNGNPTDVVKSDCSPRFVTDRSDVNNPKTTQVEFDLGAPSDGFILVYLP